MGVTACCLFFFFFRGGRDRRYFAGMLQYCAKRDVDGNSGTMATPATSTVDGHSQDMSGATIQKNSYQGIASAPGAGWRLHEPLPAHDGL